MGQQGPETILQQIEQCRRLLLDLSLRNRLLNYRPSKVRTIEVVDEHSTEVFRTLVTDEKAMSFAGLKEVSETDGLFDDDDDDRRFVAPPIDPTDRTLNTRIRETSLHLRLLRIATDARTVIEEQGVNTLFLVLGMLEWYEHESSDLARSAPLILVPVQLNRTGTGRFKLRYTGDDLGTNLSLQAKLKHDFDIQFPELPDAESLEVEDYLNEVAHKIRRLPRWKVHSDRVVLGFFSYAKYLMYKDLDPKNWPSDRQPQDHSILSEMLGEGFEAENNRLTNDEFLDPHRSPEEVHEVVDADSSQALAILDVEHGRSMVIEGPPGTGKSQTITNLIAEAVAKDQTVLFVAEKMAALEVVKRNLDRVELGCACLEIHSHKTKKKAVLEELKKTFELPRPTNHQSDGQLERLRESRDRLNDYVFALHNPVGEFGVTPYRAIGELARLQPDERGLAKGDFAELSKYTQLQFERHVAVAEELQAKIEEIGTPSEHPFFDCHPVGFLPTDEADLRAETSAAFEAARGVVEKGGQLSQTLQVNAPANLETVRKLVDTARYVAAAPAGTNRVDVPSERWLADRKYIADSIEAGSQIERLKKKFKSALLAEAWLSDVKNIRKGLVAHGDKWWRFLVGDYRRAVKSLASLCQEQCPKTLHSRMQLVDAILQYQESAKTVEKAGPVLSPLFGDEWRGEEGDWGRIAKIREWVTKLHDGIASGNYEAGVLGFFGGDSLSQGFSGKADDLESVSSQYRERLDHLCARLKPGATVLGEDLGSSPLVLHLKRLEAWLRDPAKIHEIVAYNHRRGVLEDSGCLSICMLADEWDDQESTLVDALSFTWFEGIARIAFEQSPELSSFSRTSHETVASQFKELDQRTLLLNRARVAHAHHQRMPSAIGAGTVGVLMGEFNRRRKHMPIRQLMAHCGEVIQAIKPVFMMSPLSVAMYLPQDGPKFDLVVFDEASQIRPEDAFGAVLRGKQIVVVGDSQQMPPTSFFQRMMADVEDEEDERVEAAAGDMESVLKLMRAKGAHHRSLLWHYRSHHDSLVAVSNREFYGDKLIVFPSPEREGDGQGLSLVHLPDTAYGRGGSRSNALEARAVAKTVLDHAETRTEHSVGVVAFSRAQQDAIQQELELLRSRSPALQHLERLPPHDRLFVKNLENVQGDERDVILISVGYGKDPNGFLSHNFGPVNSDGGERRLNVLITRARRQCRVFSNFKHEDVDLGRTQSRGVRVLKSFLKYAETGDLDVPQPTGSGPASPFEEAVLNRLTDLGYETHCQVGSAGFFIDLAVVDPERKGRYVIGIECDGATYHSARSARDRDRLREQVLRDKGWAIHRIWSTDWWRNPDTELRRMVDAIERAKASPNGGIEANDWTEPERESEFIERHDLGERDDPVVAEPYEIADLRIHLGGRELHDIPHIKLAEWASEVVRVESPVHEDEVLRRIREAAGIGRAGARIRAAFQSAVRYLVRQQDVERHGKFLCAAGQDEVPIRSREDVANASKRFDFVAPAEIAETVLKVVDVSYGIARSELIGVVSRVLGFRRTTASVRAIVDQEIDKLCSHGALVSQGSKLFRAHAS